MLSGDLRLVEWKLPGTIVSGANEKPIVGVAYFFVASRLVALQNLDAKVLERRVELLRAHQV